ncbi:MAG: (2Fe-2S)-binding protein [Chitinophagaceae bacterium]
MGCCIFYRTSNGGLCQ